MLKKLWQGIKGFFKYLSDEYEKTNPYVDSEKEYMRKQYFDEY